MFASTYGLETDKRHLHTCKRANSIPRGIAHIEAVCKAAHQSESKSVQRDHVRNECVATCDVFISPPLNVLNGGSPTPSRNHIEIKQGCKGAIKRTALLHGFDPEEEGEHEEKDGNSFIIIRSRDGT
jgi:hypothetical protein